MQETGAGIVGEKRPARLKDRADFVRAARGKRVHSAAFTLQIARREGTEAQPARIGLTATRKTGNAVERNRMRRRVKEALRITSDLPARAGYDYVLVLRRAALATPFGALVGDLMKSFAKTHPGGRPEKAEAERVSADRAGETEVLLAGSAQRG